MRVNAKATSPITTTRVPAMSSGEALPSFDVAGAGACCVGTATARVGDVVEVSVVVGDEITVGVGARVGAAVGTAVGEAVGTGVGTGGGATVGGCVGGGVAAARTMTVPIIATPWMPQT